MRANKKQDESESRNGRERENGRSESLESDDGENGDEGTNASKMEDSFKARERQIYSAGRSFAHFFVVHRRRCTIFMTPLMASGIETPMNLSDIGAGLQKAVLAYEHVRNELGAVRRVEALQAAELAMRAQASPPSKRSLAECLGVIRATEHEIQVHEAKRRDAEKGRMALLEEAAALQRAIEDLERAKADGSSAGDGAEVSLSQACERFQEASRLEDAAVVKIMQELATANAIGARVAVPS